MSDYTPPPGSEWAAQMVHRSRVEMDRAQERLKDAPIEQTKRVVHDPRESLEVRHYALGVLLKRRQVPEMTEALLCLFDDPMPELWQSVITSYCLRRAGRAVGCLGAGGRVRVWRERRAAA